MEPQRTRHQEKLIKNFYRNRPAISMQRAQELVSDLYLTTGKKRDQVWKHLVGHLEQLGLPAEQVAHLQLQDNPELVAETLKKLA
jgi:hypothetical protein